jgi:hypothetical protein
MTAFSFEAEVRLIRWGESSSAGRTITLELPPDTGDGHPFKGFSAGHSHGQRFRMQFNVIADDEQVSPAGTHHPQQERVFDEPDSTGPLTKPSTPAGELQKQRYAALSPAEQAVTRAALLPKDERFRAWILEKRFPDARAAGADPVDEDEAARCVREICCNCNSRKLIADVPEYLDRFLAMETSFLQDIGLMARPR